MAFDQTAFNNDLQTLANTYQVHITGTATPVDPQSDPFDVTAQAELPVAPVTASETVTDTNTDQPTA